MEKIKDFYLELAKDDYFKEKLRQFIQENGSDYEKIIENLILPQAKKMDYNFTKEDLIAYEKENKSNVLTDNDLLNVAGGFGISPKITAITLGAIMSLSAIGTAASNFMGSSKTNQESISAAAPETSYTQSVEDRDDTNFENNRVNQLESQKDSDILNQKINPANRLKTIFTSPNVQKNIENKTESQDNLYNKVSNNKFLDILKMLRENSTQDVNKEEQQNINTQENQKQDTENQEEHQNDQNQDNQTEIDFKSIVRDAQNKFTEEYFKLAEEKLNELGDQENLDNIVAAHNFAIEKSYNDTVEFAGNHLKNIENKTLETFMNLVKEGIQEKRTELSSDFYEEAIRELDKNKQNEIQDNENQQQDNVNQDANQNVDDTGTPPPPSGSNRQTTNTGRTQTSGLPFTADDLQNIKLKKVDQNNEKVKKDDLLSGIKEAKDNLNKSQGNNVDVVINEFNKDFNNKSKDVRDVGQVVNRAKRIVNDLNNLEEKDWGKYLDEISENEISVGLSPVRISLYCLRNYLSENKEDNEKVYQKIRKNFRFCDETNDLKGQKQKRDEIIRIFDEQIAGKLTDADRSQLRTLQTTYNEDINDETENDTDNSTVATTSTATPVTPTPLATQEWKRVEGPVKNIKPTAKGTETLSDEGLQSVINKLKTKKSDYNTLSAADKLVHNLNQLSNCKELEDIGKAFAGCSEDDLGDIYIALENYDKLDAESKSDRVKEALEKLEANKEVANLFIENYENSVIFEPEFKQHSLDEIGKVSFSRRFFINMLNEDDVDDVDDDNDMWQ